MTNVERLRILGEALYGPRWKRAVAGVLSVDPRQVWRWTSEGYEPSAEYIDALRKAAAARRDAIETVIRKTEA
ncbi:hypothetical protein [uncultured Paracoccus sp.]|uniref:hypothetical protein n=1 Tax=uncultured Paracoccus sp. TaxID=189685 RepID=UPI0026053903|nr:hypothetical protein [uncultured Paracoccus sp.]